MYDQSLIDSAWGGQQAQQKAAAQTLAGSKKKGDLLTSLLPTAGGIGGGALGGAAGGALAGTAILPGIGTVAGGLLGALLGGAGGGALGKVAENKIEGQSLGHDVAKEAAINGVFSAGPLRLLKGAGTAGKVLAGIGDNEAAAHTAAQGGGKLWQALNAGATAGAAPSAFKTAVAGKLDDTAASMAQKGLKINDTKFLSDFNKQAGEPVGDFARRFGIPHNGLESTVQNVLQPGFATHAAAVDAIGSISKNDVLKQIESQVAKKAASADPVDKAFAKSVMDRTQGILDNLPDNIPATKLNEIKSGIAAQVNHGATDNASINANQMLDHISTGFRKTINEAANKSGIGVDPSLAKLGYKAKDVGGLGEELNHLKTLLDKAEVKSWTGSGTNPIGLTPAIMASAGGPAGVAAGLGTQLINSTAGKKGLAKGIDAIASRVDKSAVKSANPYTTGSVTKRVAPVGLLGALSGNQSNSAQMTTDPTMNNPSNAIDPLSQNPDQNASATPDTSQDPSSPFNPANIEANVQQILASGGKMSDATAYLSLVKTMQDLTGGASRAKPLNSTQQQQAFNAQTGLDSLSQIQQAIQKNPNIVNMASLPGGRLTAGLLGTGDFRAAIANTTDVIGRLRSGGAISGGEEARFRSMLPQSGDSQQVAMQKIQNVQSLLSKFANPQAAAQDPQDLLTALGAQ